ncbi:LxmA leader domain family RiPP [Streptomyces sp. NPDC057376]|uniref:LxmA leader domain family RiPP n=1 Tax=unclassified Streptomyces TaxID=2593676 RepID=UPI00130193AC|nr:LxmA leader domain family RiPP [Streptomyces sp. CB02414]
MQNDIEIMELVGGFEAYTEAAELNMEASVEAPAATPTATIVYTKFSVASVTLTAKKGC